MHGGECAGSRALLGLRCAAAVAALRTRQDAARGDDQDVAVGELLLELAGEAAIRSLAAARAYVGRGVVDDLPLLRAMPALQDGNRYKDDDCLAPVADLDL